MKYSHILFDLDNTILDFNNASKISFGEMMKDYGLDLMPGLYNIYQAINKKVWRELEEGKIKQITVRTKRWNLFFEEIDYKGVEDNEANDLYLDYLVKYAKPIPGAIDVLAKCKDAGIVLTMVTNGLKEIQRKKIAQYKLDTYFDHIVISDEIGVAKPKTTFFDYVFDQINHPSRDEVIIVGDTLTSDVKGGLDYNIDACWYNYEDIVNESEIQPTFEIKHITQIEPIVLAH